MLLADSPVGVRYLAAVTTLLQRRRLGDPLGDVWEAADLQWWWARRGRDDSADARVWHDSAGPVGAVVFTHWTTEHLGCDVIGAADFQPAWAFVADRCAASADQRIDMALPDEAGPIQEAARRSGFGPTDDTYAVCWLDPDDRRAPRRPLPAGYRIVARADDPARPHPMIQRNGLAIESRLRQCSLYDPRLDLAVLAPDGAAAGYALFWADPVTGVGLVEPMRVEDEHAGKGLASQLLDAGLRALIAHGCTRLKISYQPSNGAAARVYTQAGFVLSRFDRMWAMPPGPRPDSSPPVR